MKLKTLIARAYEIISEEFANVYDEFHEDDGTITPENEREAIRLETRMHNWMLAAERVLPVPKSKLKPKKPAPRGVVQKKPARKIVVVPARRSELE
jgi:hypothetical protein